MLAKLNLIINNNIYDKIDTDNDKFRKIILAYYIILYFITSISDIADFITDLIMIYHYYYEGLLDLFIVGLISIYLPLFLILLGIIFIITEIIKNEDTIDRTTKYCKVLLIFSVVFIIFIVCYPIYVILIFGMNVWHMFNNYRNDDKISQQIFVNLESLDEGHSIEDFKLFDLLLSIFIMHPMISLFVKLFEDIPQLILNIIYIKRMNNIITISSEISLIFSIISLIITTFLACKKAWKCCFTMYIDDCCDDEG